MRNPKKRLVKLEGQKNFNKKIKLIPVTSKADDKTLKASISSFAKKMDGTSMNCVVGINIIDKKSPNHSIYFSNGKCESKVENRTSSDFSIDTDSKTWLQITSGQLNPIIAVYTGKMDINGDLSIAKKMLVKAGLNKSNESINF